MKAEAAPVHQAAADAGFRPQSRLFQAPAEAPQQHMEQVRPAFVEAPAPAPVAAPVQQRMPRVEDFPPVVRAELEATHEMEGEERGPMGLLKRLTAGLSRREEEPARLQPAQPREPRLRQPSPEPRRLQGNDAQIYAPKRGQLDDHGRVSVQPRAVQEDDQLEIPAFLRRQAN